MYLLKVKNISKIYHDINGETLSINNVSFNIKENDFISIIGTSGCGKSTLLNIIASLDKDYKGEIIKKKGLRIGYMFQEDALFNWLTILDNALLGLIIKKELTIKNKKYVLELLDKYGLKEFINKKPTSLSGGMRQRVALIRTLATKPDLLLLDEPFSALDYQTRLQVSDDVYNIIKKEKKSVLMVTHDISEAISMSNKVIVLSKRPAIIKSIHDIELTNLSSPINNRKSNTFPHYYELLWKELKEDE